MKLYSVERMREAMNRQNNIRNLSVIAHVDHGKTTLTDSLLSAAGLLATDQAGNKCATDTRVDEQLRGITIKSTAVSMLYELTEEEMSPMVSTKYAPSGSEFLVNLIDCPGHVDFSSEVTAALRVTDGAMVVVDAVSGVCVQTETVLRQALAEGIRPVLMINKLDRLILERQLDPESLYQQVCSVIRNANAVIDAYSGDSCPALEGIVLDPSLGNVAFGAGLHGWGFTLHQMAQQYARKLGIKTERLMCRLWGDHYYNAEQRKWSEQPGPGYIRGFCKFVMEPIYKMLTASLDNDDPSVCFALCDKLSLKLTPEERSLRGKPLMSQVMRRWLPAGAAMFQLVILQLPCPAEAQSHRVPLLYEGPLDDDAAVAIKGCDSSGPLMMYVSKMVPATDNSRFYAFGRVFSGTIATGQKVRIMGPNYRPDGGKDTDLYIKTVPRTLVMMGGGVLAVDEIPSGNVCGLVGIDKWLLKTGTITTLKNAHNMKVLRFSVSPVVRVAVETNQPADLPRLLEGLKRLVKSDPMVQVQSENGQHIVAGAGELHLDVCLKDLEEQFAGVPIRRSHPVVAYRETVTANSDRVCLAKSGNKHNRLYMRASPLPDELVDDIEKGIVHAGQEMKERTRRLVDHYGWDAGEARRIWSFGPEGRGPSFLVDCTKGQQNLNDIKDTVVAGFQWAMQEGCLCEESVRGVRIDILDAMVHSDPACRRGGQIIPAARRAVMAAMLTAQPRLQEPVFLVEVQCPQTSLGGVYSVVTKRRGHVIEEQAVEGSPLYSVKAYLPVNESFGFAEDLRAATGGKAFPQCIFDHWQVLPGDPRDPGSRAGNVIMTTRKRKALQEEVPVLEHFLDKL